MSYLNSIDCFFGNYFHQDWDLLGSNYEEVIKSFLEDFHEDFDAIVAVNQDLDHLLTHFPDELGIKKEVEKYGCEYCPYPSMSYKSWIASIHLILSDYILKTKIN